ncbi:hypothetical protein J4N42_21240 [Vibrio sp. SCSIO 43135]|uniref:hypothetical protein n=1 Tax=Vibrio sp. SCSIO 43135 TaxID=2819096 RepID=UPI002075BF25|nr:hypothetical protein [Vibrio sp. SCSIO 43135]USD43122.1 hypothetical protein J4N42_21240 [Vibrio sp. SCSIO 43135]
MPKLNLHLGVHKTGTTFIQDQVALYSAENHTHFEYAPLNVLRRHITYKLKKPLFPLRYKLSKVFNFDKNLLISDENMIGVSEQIPETGEIYKDTSAVIERFKQALPNHELTVYLSLRSPLPYLVSMYSEYLRHFPYMCFNTFSQHIDGSTFLWSDRFKSAFTTHNDIQFVISDFDNFKENKLDWVSALTFGEQSVLSERVARSRKTLTSETIQVLSQLGENSSKVLRVLEDNAYTHGNRFAPYDDKQLEVADKRYQDDLNYLGKFPNITLMR